tara:strand:- start:350 stop:499 length:150 start_codon:yes stop_codon:yes gene_type:complete
VVKDKVQDQEQVVLQDQQVHRVTQVEAVQQVQVELRDNQVQMVHQVLQV